MSRPHLSPLSFPCGPFSCSFHRAFFCLFQFLYRLQAITLGILQADGISGLKTDNSDQTLIRQIDIIYILFSLQTDIVVGRTF